MSLYARLAALLVVLVVLAGTHWKAYTLGGNQVRIEWQEEKLQQQTQAENLRLLKQTSVDKVSKDFTEKSQKDRQTTITIIKEVDRYVPIDTPMLPGSFRVYHDASAKGETPGDPSGADASSVDPKDLATTLAENYGDCREDKERLKALQDILRKTILQE